MSKKPTNNNIDNVFRDSIDNLETEPSENFWVKASEDALFKSNQAKKKAVSQWRTIAAALAIALVSLSAYVIYIQKEINTLHQQVADSKITYSQPVTQKEEFTSTNNYSNPTPVVAVKIKEQKNQLKNSAIIPSVKHNNKVGTKNNTSSPVIIAGRQLTGEEVKSMLQSPYVTYSQSPPANSTYTSDAGTEKNNRVSASTSKTFPVAFETKGTIIAMNGIAMGPLQPAVCQTGAPEINLPEDYVKPIENKNLLSKFSISLFYEPYISDELLENDGADNVVVNNSVVSSEEEVNPFVLGARVEYNATSHWSFITGCSFYNFKVSFQPTTIYAQQLQNGDVGYAFQTSVGTVNCPYGSSNPTVGDAMIVKGTYTTNYINIPLFVKYNFLLKNRWNLYITTGAQVNVVAYRKVDMYWQDMKWNGGEAVEGVSNSNNVYYSFYVAPGLSYKLCKRTSIYAEPSLQGSPTLIDRNGVAKSSSIYTGIGTGITYAL